MAKESTGGFAHIPREDDENRADGCSPNKSLEPFLRLALDVLQNLVADLEEIHSPLDGRGDFLGRISDGPTHLGGQFQGELILVLFQAVEEFLDNVLSFLESRLAKLQKRVCGDLREQLQIGGTRAIAGDDNLVGIGGDGIDDLDRHGYVFLARAD